SVSIKEFKGKGYPLSKVVSLVWGAAEADINAAGGVGGAGGYTCMQLAGVGKESSVLRGVKRIYKGQAKPAHEGQANSVIYNRGVFLAAIHLEAVRNAIKAKGGGKPTGEDVKNGMEQIKDFTLGGLVPPLNITPEDHEGGGWVQIWTVKGGKFE